MADDTPDWAAPDWASDEPAAAPRQTGRERTHAFREALRAESPEVPAGQEMPGPDLSGERGTAKQIAGEWGDVALGAAQSPLAATGIPGDIESMGRGTINAFAPPGQPAVSPETIWPTTAEGGLFGTRHGLGVMESKVNPRQAFGRQIPGMLLGTKFAKGKPAAEPPPTLPTVPLSEYVAIPRQLPGGGTVRLLPPDIPHTPLPKGTSTVGATTAGSPLEGVSPQTIAKLREMFSEEGITPYTLESRLEEMSPHQFLGEFSPNTEAWMGAAAGPPGQSKLEIVNSIGQRGREAGQRLRGELDSALGEKENIAQLQRVRDIETKKIVDPLYQAFEQLRIPPTVELQELMPRLEAANVFGVAKHKAAVEGKPWQLDFGTGYGPIEGGMQPTARSWDYVKRALDQKIAESFNQYGKPTDYTRIYTGLKADLLDAIDNHPNPQVAGVWKQARQAFATKAQITDAERLGKKLFTADPDEWVFMTSGMSAPELAAVRRSARAELDRFLGSGREGKKNMAAIDKVLAPNNQSNLRWIINDDAKADALFSALEHEVGMHGLAGRVHGGSQTQPRQMAQKHFVPPEISGGLEMLETGIGMARHPVLTSMNLAKKAGIDKFSKAQEAKYSRLREEAARLFTLQGPERDAVIRYLASPEEMPRQTGGRVVLRARGGAVGHQPSRQLYKNARKAPDGKFYIPDPKRPGKYLRIDS